MKIKDIEPCPFCGAKVEDHPDKHTDGVLFVIYHKSNRYLNRQRPKGILYLLHKDELKEWNNRNN